LYFSEFFIHPFHKFQLGELISKRLKSITPAKVSA